MRGLELDLAFRALIYQANSLGLICAKQDRLLDSLSTQSGALLTVSLAQFSPCVLS